MYSTSQVGHSLTSASMETIPLRTSSILETSAPSLKQVSQTAMILCRSSSMLLVEHSGEISAPRLLK